MKKDKLFALFIIFDILIGIGLFVFYKPTGIGKDIYCSFNPDHVDCLTSQNIEFLNASWKLTELNNENMENFNITLTIQSDSISMKICNTIDYGDVVINESHINFHSNASYTKMYCQGELGSIEGRIRQILNKPMLYAVNPEENQLIIVEKENKLIFVRT